MIRFIANPTDQGISHYAATVFDSFGRPLIVAVVQKQGKTWAITWDKGAMIYRGSFADAKQYVEETIFGAIKKFLE